MNAMNSSVTVDSDTAVMSSSCFAISPRRRSNGPSNTPRCTSKPPRASGAASSSKPAMAASVCFIARPERPSRDQPHQRIDHGAEYRNQDHPAEEDRDRAEQQDQE